MKKAKEQKPMADEKKQKRTVDLVTGPASGLGIHIIKELLERGDEVRVIIREEPSKSESWKRLPRGVIPYIADITLKHVEDEKRIENACKGVDNIFHIAGRGGLSITSLEDSINANVIGTENVLRAYLNANAEDRPVRFFLASTISVYGHFRPGETITEESETKPEGSYGETKLMAEQVVIAFADVHRCVEYTIFRIGNMYGSHYEKPFNKLFRNIAEGKMRYFGSSMNHLTLVYAD